MTWGDRINLCGHRVNRSIPGINKLPPGKLPRMGRCGGFCALTYSNADSPDCGTLARSIRWANGVTRPAGHVMTATPVAPRLPSSGGRQYKTGKGAHAR